VHTDQQALKYLLTAPVRTSRQERWLAEIMRFMPDIKYVKGSDNVVADALPRRVDLAAMHVFFVVASSLVQDILKHFCFRRDLQSSTAAVVSGPWEKHFHPTTPGHKAHSTFWQQRLANIYQHTPDKSYKWCCNL
jgi:hypothetical protein